MNKEEILKIVVNSAKKYKENLENKNIMFVYQEKSKIDYIETRFTSNNFLHLTGLEYEREINGRKIKSPTKFYQDILNKRVSIHNIKIKNQNTIKLKLKILYNLMSITTSAKMIGNYDNTTKNLLITDKIIGNITYCIGFKKVNSLYIPNTSLKEDIRVISKETNRIILIFSKDFSESKYKKLTYISKNANLVHILKNEKLKNMIDIKKLYSDNISCNQKISEYLSNET